MHGKDSHNMKKLELATRLNLSNKLYQQSLWPAVQKVAEGKILDAPILVEIDTTTHCDFACPECVSGNLLNNGGFSRERLIELAHEIVEAGVLVVIFVGGGEPLAHPAIGDVLTILGEAGVKIGIITSGTLINKYVEPLSRYTDWVRVSVDAATPETFEVFRPHRSGKNGFARVIANMQLLKEYGARCVGFSFLLMTRQDQNGEIIASNYHEVFAGGVLAKELGCDYFEVKPVFDPVTHVVIPQPPMLLDTLRQQLGALEAIEDERFRVIYPQALVELLTQEYMAKLEPYGKCHICELRSLITPHGLYICPLYRGKDHMRFGDVKTMSLKEVWNSRQRIELMESIEPHKDCLPKCSRHLSNLDIFRMTKGEIQPTVIEDFDLFF